MNCGGAESCGTIVSDVSMLLRGVAFAPLGRLVRFTVGAISCYGQLTTLGMICRRVYRSLHWLGKLATTGLGRLATSKKSSLRARENNVRHYVRVQRFGESASYLYIGRRKLRGGIRLRLSRMPCKTRLLLPLPAWFWLCKSFRPRMYISQAQYYTIRFTVPLLGRFSCDRMHTKSC